MYSHACVHFVHKNMFSVVEIQFITQYKVQASQWKKRRAISVSECRV